MDSGTPNREYECSLGFVLLLGDAHIFEMLSSICHLLDYV